MSRTERIEGRNPVLECLVRGRRSVRKVWLDRGAKPEPRVDRIRALCAERGVPLEVVARPLLDQMCLGRVHNGVVADADVLPDFSTADILNGLPFGHDPLIVLADGLSYEHNLGAVLRSCLGFGVDALVVPTRRGAQLSPVVSRVAMGGAEVVPVVHEGLFVSLRALKDADVQVVGADMDGLPADQVDLRGPLALIVGEEGGGLSSKLRERCRAVVSIPLSGALESLNVSVATGILLYEKRRQDRLGWTKGA